MDEVSSAGFGFGYLGGVLSFAVFLAAELTNGFDILDGNGVARFSFWLSAGWWLLFAWPLMKNGQQRYGVPDAKNRIANSWQRVLQTLRHINHYRQAFWLLQHSGQVFGNSGTGFGWTGYAMDRQLALGNLFFGDSFCDRSGHLFDSATSERC